MADSGSTQSASQAQSGLNEANEASQSESEKAAVQRMHQATQAEAEARRQLEEAYQENQRLAQQLQTPPQNQFETILPTSSSLSIRGKRDSGVNSQIR